MMTCQPTQVTPLPVALLRRLSGQHKRKAIPEPLWQGAGIRTNE